MRFISSFSQSSNTSFLFYVAFYYILLFFPPIKFNHITFISVQDVRIDMNRDAWLRPSLESNVREGCRVQNPCHANPCPSNSTCIDLWDLHECICDMGKEKI